GELQAGFGRLALGVGEHLRRAFDPDDFVALFRQRDGVVPRAAPQVQNPADGTVPVFRENTSDQVTLGGVVLVAVDRVVGVRVDGTESPAKESPRLRTAPWAGPRSPGATGVR